MVRLLFSIAATLLVMGARPVEAAPPLQLVPDSAYRNDAPAPHYAQLDRGRAVSPMARRQPHPAVQQPARVYLLRGFMNVFSLGMDDLATQIQANGIAAMVTNHADAEYLVARIVAAYQAGDRSPIVLIGHSLGADAVIEMAQDLDRYNIPVAAAILFDGTAPHAVPRNVTTAVNFTQRFELTPGAEFHGTISNVDLRGDEGIDHLTIDKSPSLQAQALGYVLRAASAAPILPAPRP